MLVALSCRLFLAFTHPIWFDESSVLHRIFQIQEGTRIPLNASKHIFYYGILFMLGAIFGHSLLLLRLVSALAAVATIPLIFLMGRKMASEGAGLVAASFMSLSVLAIRSERSYPILVLVVCLFVYLDMNRQHFVSQNRGRLFVFLYGILGGLACWLHYAGAFFVVVHLAVNATFGRKREGASLTMPALLVVAILAAPAFFAMFRCVTERKGFEFLVQANLSSITVAYQDKLLTHDEVVFVLIAVASMLGGLQFLVDAERPKVRGLIYLSCWLILPSLALYLFSAFFFPVFNPRYLILSFPALALFLGITIASDRAVSRFPCATCLLFSMVIAYESLYKGLAFAGEGSETLLLPIDFIIENTPDKDIPVYGYKIKDGYYYHAPLMLAGYRGKIFYDLAEQQLENACGGDKPAKFWYLTDDLPPSPPCWKNVKPLKSFSDAGVSAVLYENH
jgi:uncharacterized membrane protein